MDVTLIDVTDDWRSRRLDPHTKNNVPKSPTPSGGETPFCSVQNIFIQRTPHRLI